MDNPLVAALVGAFLGIITTYVGAVVKFRQDLRAEYDKDLRTQRILEYRTLWKLTAIFPKYGRTHNVTQADLQGLAVALRDWYFDGGGMYLSDESRGAYFALQEELGARMQPDSSADEVIVDEPVYEAIRSKCSALRKKLVEDVGTRKEPEIAQA